MANVPFARDADVIDQQQAAAARAEANDRLPRRLGIWSAAAVLVGSTIGSGIFRIVGAENGVADRVGTVGAMSLLWIVGALVALGLGAYGLAGQALGAFDVRELRDRLRRRRRA